MASSRDEILAIASLSLCGALISFRCGYRLLCCCNIHTTCSRKWHLDDTMMALASIPLAARTVCILLSLNLNPSQTFSLPSPGQVAASGLTAQQLEENYVVARKLLIPSRIFYALYLWCLKGSILNLYYRCLHGSRNNHRVLTVLVWSLVITFFAILVPTIGECRPTYLFWAPDPENIHNCHRALGNLITMVVLNIITDFALILYPSSVLWKLSLSLCLKIQLAILFSVGILVIMIDLIRLPVIVKDGESQLWRSFWASIEIMGACVVANAAFYYTLVKDVLQGHRSQPSSEQPNYHTQVQQKSFDLPRKKGAEEYSLVLPDHELALDDVLLISGETLDV